MLAVPGTEAAGVRPIPGGQRRSADTMEEDAEDDRHGHRGQNDLRLRRIQRVECNEAEDDGRKSAGTEPSDEGDSGSIQSRSHHGQRNGHHAHNRESENGEDDVTPPSVLEAGNQHGCTEEEPHQQGRARCPPPR